MSSRAKHERDEYRKHERINIKMQIISELRCPLRYIIN